MAEYTVGAHFHEMPDRRKICRTLVSLRAKLLFSPNYRPLDCSLRDVTNAGAGIGVVDLKIIPMDFEVSFDNFRSARKCRLIWRSGIFIGTALRIEFGQLRFKRPRSVLSLAFFSSAHAGTGLMNTFRNNRSRSSRD